MSLSEEILHLKSNEILSRPQYQMEKETVGNTGLKEKKPYNELRDEFLR